MHSVNENQIIVTISFLLYPNQLISVVTSALGIGDKFGLRIVSKLGRPRKHPEIVCAATADERVCVVRVDLHHAIVGIERTEERDAQKRRFVCPLAFPDPLLDS